MLIEICAACKQEMAEGPALGHLCYHCIEETVTDHIKGQELETKRREAREAILAAQLENCFQDFVEAQQQLIEELKASEDPKTKEYGDKMNQKLKRKVNHYTKVLAAAREEI